MSELTITKKYLRRRTLTALALVAAIALVAGLGIAIVKREVDLRVSTTEAIHESLRALDQIDMAVRAANVGGEVARIRMQMAETVAGASLDRLDRFRRDGRLSPEAMRLALGGRVAETAIGQDLRRVIGLFLADASGGGAGAIAAASLRTSLMLEQMLKAENAGLRRSLNRWSLAVWSAVGALMVGGLVAFLTVYLQIERRILASQEAQLQRGAEAVLLAEAKNRFLAMLGHEIRTPLNGVLGVTELMLDTDLTEEQRRYLGVVDRSSRALVAMMEDVLTLARMEDRGIELDAAPFSVVACVDDVAALFEPVAQSKNVGLTVSTEPGLALERIGDEGRLRQILSNLVSNAVKFSEKGVVSLLVQAGEKHDEIRFIVRDEGPGIAKEAQKRIFERFEQADENTARMFGGSGLGLSIVAALVEAMGGRIDLQSAPGEGSEFTVSLRLPIASGVCSAERARQNPGDARPAVLVAEDNMINQIVVREMLQPEGCAVEIVETGADALKRALETEFDLILMDLQMPVMGGIEAAERIAEQEAQRGLKRTPIVALTANAMAENRRQAREAGMQGFIAKPIDLDTLRGVLSQFVASGSQGEAQKAAG